MNTPLLSDDDVTALLAGLPITQVPPWAGGDAAAIDAHLAHACNALEQALGARSRIVWDDYGSGYASFVDAWFYLAPAGADADAEQSCTGLVVLFSRLSPWYVFMQGDKGWNAQGGSSYLPSFDMVDRFETAGVIGMAGLAQDVLAQRGFVRACRAGLSAPLPIGQEVPTILGDPPYTQFDALFHWAD